MRAVVQRVASSSVKVENEVVGSVGKGLMVLLGVTHDDCEEDVKYLAEKISNLRIFEDENEKMNLSLLDVKGELLAISQFTLYGDCRKGRRPNFTDAAKPDIANRLYELFIKELEGMGIHVQTGSFGAHMMVDILNDGPVTMLLDSKRSF